MRRRWGQFVEWSLVDVVRGVEGAPGLDRVDVVQPVLWAVMVSLAQLWRSVGVVPDAVLGHSQGEIAAAYVAGVLSLEDAAAVVALRSRLLVPLAGAGGMASLGCGVERARELVARWGDRLSIAAVNSVSAVVVAGECDALEELVQQCEVEGVWVRRIDVDYASHSAQVDVIYEGLVEALVGIEPRSTSTAFFSTVTGDLIDTADLDGRYWYRGIRQTVEFDRAVCCAREQGYNVFVESSAHPVLLAAIEESFAEGGGGFSGAVVVPTLGRDDGGLERFWKSVGRLFVEGVGVDWSAVFAGCGARRVQLPTYAFQRQRFWLTSGPVAGDAKPSMSAEELRFWQAVEDQDLEAFTRSLSIDKDATLRAALPALSSWRRARAAETVLGSCRYRVTWRPAEDKPVASSMSGVWLVVVPEEASASGLAEQCATAIEESGAEVRMIVANNDCDRDSLRTMLGGVSTGVVGVLSLMGIDACQFSYTGTLRTMHLVQALVDGGLLVPLWSLTQGAVSVSTSDPLRRPSEAAVWGLGRVVGLEEPEIWGGLIDLPEVVTDQCLSYLCAQLSGRSAEDQIAIRHDGFYLRRLIQDARSAPTLSSSEWKPQGTVLITGGMGAIGGLVAKWLVTQFKSVHLLLLSRRGMEAPGAYELVSELRSSGGSVTVEKCDVSDEPAVAEVLGRIPSDQPLDAVFHIAGESILEPLSTTSDRSLIDLMTAKLKGTQVLSDLTESQQLSAFVAFSSIAGIWGSSSQSAYAAANAFLDAFAESRRTHATPTTAIAWGPWPEGGMVTHDGARILERIGLKLFSPDVAITALHDSLNQSPTTLTVVDVDWDLFYGTIAAARPRPFFHEIPEVKNSRESTEPGQHNQLAQQLQGLSPEQQHELLLKMVCGQVAAVLGHSSAEAINPGQSFQGLGFNSLSAVELRNSLKTATGLTLSPTLIFDYPTPAAVAARLRAVLPLDATTPDTDQAAWSLLKKIKPADLESSGLLEKLLRLAGEGNPQEGLSSVSSENIDTLNPEALVEMALRQEGDPTNEESR